MGCHEMNLLILSHLDGDLSEDGEATLREHVAGCDACARELAAWQRLSGALRGIGREEAQAPPEFSALVTAKLREQRGKPLGWLPATWRSAIAAAAAVLLIAGGTLASGLRIADVEKMIGLSTPAPQVETDPGGAPTTGERPVGKDPSQTGVVTQDPNDPGVTDGDPEENPTGAPEDSGEAPPDNDNNEAANGETGQTTIAPVGKEEPLAFLKLKDSLQIRSTVLKVSVEDLAGATTKSISMADGAGAVTQDFEEGKNGVMLRLTVTADQAPGLISDLAGMGSLVQREDGNSDVTSSYNEKVVEYNDLLSRKKTARNAEELRRLEEQAASRKQLLDAWENEEGKRAITLWLEEGR